MTQVNGLYVLENYGAFQGEGTLVGQPSYFIRFSGCSVGCKWCDTKYSWKSASGTMYNVNALLDVIEGSGYENIVFTGGEPFEQDATLLSQLAVNLTPEFFKQITWETSGTQPIPSGILQSRIPTLLSLAPKLLSAESNYPFPDLNPFLRAALEHPLLTAQIKFVLNVQDLKAMQQELAYIRNIIHRYDLVSTNVPIIYTPVTVFNRDPVIVRNQIAIDMERLNLWFQHNSLYQMGNYRILPQMHAMVYGSKKGI